MWDASDIGEMFVYAGNRMTTKGRSVIILNNDVFRVDPWDRCRFGVVGPYSMSLPKEVELALKYEVAYLRNHEYRRRSLENPQTPNR